MKKFAGASDIKTGLQLVFMGLMLLPGGFSPWPAVRYRRLFFCVQGVASLFKKITAAE
jgi:hypothetical protein